MNENDTCCMEALRTDGRSHDMHCTQRPQLATGICNCATYGGAALCPIHTQTDYDRAEAHRAAENYDEVRFVKNGVVVASFKPEELPPAVIEP